MAAVMGVGGSAAPSPTWEDNGSYLATATPTAEAVATRSQLMSHWAEDAAPPVLDVQSLISDLDSGLSIDPNDKGKSLQRLEQAATAKKEEAHQQLGEHAAKLDGHEAYDKEQVKQHADAQLRQVKDGAKTPEAQGEHQIRGGDHGHHAPGHKPTPQVCAPVTKDSLKLRVEQTTQRELAELSANYQKETKKLDSKIGEKLNDLDAEKQKQEGKVGNRAGKGQQELKDDIAKRAGKHVEEIAKEQTTIDAEAATQNKGISHQGAADKGRAQTEQTKQAALTTAHAHKRAADVHAKAQTEGSQALTNASARGKEMTDAATARSTATPGGERPAVVAQGTQRNSTALLTGQKRQQDILGKGEADANAAIEEGKQASAAMAHGGKPGTATYADQLEASTKAGSDRVDGSAHKANTDMKAVSTQAVSNMDDAAAESKKRSGEQAGAASTTMTSAQSEAKASANQEKTAAQAKLQSTYESSKAKIQAKGKAELAKIDQSKETDLCKLEKQVSGDLKSMEQMAERADMQMAGQVKLAERKVAAEVAKKKLAMQRAAQQAISAINGFLAQARQKIKAADKNTLKDIHAAGKVGHQGVIDTGKQALADVTKNNDAIVQKVATDGAADRTSIDAHAKASEEAMTKTAAETKGAIDEQVIDETLAVTGKTIQKKAWYDWTSDKEANTALNALTSLPKDLQGKAIEKLPADQFKNLISEVPEKRREEFESLVEATTDPDRKLQLWAAYAKSKAHNDADRLKGDTGPWFGGSKEQQENLRRDVVRQNIAKTTDQEVDEEVAHLRELQNNGTPLTKEAVGDLYERKKLENQIEMKYNVNLTNETGNTNTQSGASADKSKRPQDRVVWSKDELQEVEKGLSRQPEEAVAGNDHLKAITRRGGDFDWDESNHKWKDSGVRAWHTPEGQIIINDAAALNPHGAHPRFTDGSGNPIQSDLSGDPTRPGYDHANIYSPASSISGTLTHEIGHDIAQKHPEILAKITASSDWQLGDTRVDASGNVVNQEADLRAHLQTQGLNAAQIAARIKAMKGSNFENETFGGRQYNYNYHSHKVESFAEGAIPAANGSKAGDYDYMRAEPGEQFAELYSKIANAPTQAHADLVGDPAQKTNQAQTALTLAQHNAAAKPGDAAAAKQLTDAQNALATAQSNQKALQTQWNVMRNEVYHTDDAQNNATASLTTHAGTPNAQQQTLLNDFNARAAECGTPDQIEQLRRDYQSRLDAAKTP